MGELLSATTEALRQLDPRLPERAARSIEAYVQRLEAIDLGAADESSGPLGLWRRQRQLDATDPTPASMIARIGVLTHLEGLLAAPGSGAVATAIGADAEQALLAIRLRLGELLFWLARRTEKPHGRKVWRALMPQAVSVLSLAEPAARAAAAPEELSLLLRTRGVARLHLVERDREASGLLNQALFDLEEAYALGETDAVHLDYLRSAHARRFELHGDFRSLDRLEQLPEPSAKANRQSAEELAKVRTWQSKRLSDHDRAAAAAKLREAVAAASLGLTLPPGRIVRDESLLGVRGYAYLSLYNLGGRREPGDLAAAVDDLRAAAILGYTTPSLLSALLATSYRLKGDRPAEAEAILLEARTAAARLANEKVRAEFLEKIRANLFDCQIRLALGRDDVDSLRTGFRDLLAMAEQAHLFAFPLYYAARRLADEAGGLADDEALGVVALLDAGLRATARTGPEVVQFNSHAISLLRRVGDGRSAEIHRRFVEMIASAPDLVSPLHYAFAGEFALRLGREHRRRGETALAAAHFEDARAWLARSLDLAEPLLPEGGTPVDRVMSLSRLGDACLHLHAVGGPLRLCREAIRHFLAARRLGSEAPELLGRLADANFRMGRYERDPVRLKMALDLRQQARRAGATRESWSVSAAICELLHDIEGNPAWLEQAARASVETHRTDPSWPWPFLQMARIARKGVPKEVWAGLVDWRPTESPSDDAQWAAELEARAVELAIETTEFGEHVLGGRSSVYVVEDSHHLLSTSLVLKPTKHDQAKVEAEATSAFAEYLAARPSAGHFRLPQPVAIRTRRDGRCVYAMRRAMGVTLAEHLAGRIARHESAALTEDLRAALRFLAHFHAWRAQGAAPLGDATGASKRDLKAVASALWLNSAKAKDLRQAVSAALTFELPILAKKDAHAENWLVAGNELVMLDLEATGERPLLFEVVQLIEDVPVFPADEGGWATRIGLAREYEAFLVSEGVLATPLPEDSFAAAYMTFWILRCAFGIGRAARPGLVLPSAVLKFERTRRDRHFTALNYMAADAPRPELRTLAMHVRLLAKRLPGPGDAPIQVKTAPSTQEAPSR